jgi:putative ABC transport system ATP-binding protein
MFAPFGQHGRVRRVNREGARRHPVLRELSLSVRRGETLALLGRSGSGKSTLLNLTGGIDTPDAGSVTVDGVNLTALSERRRTLFRRRRIGLIYQFFNLIPTLTAAENIALVLELNDRPAGEVRRRTRQMLNDVGLEAMGGRFPDQLSGGEQQRVALARALVHSPDLVLADEPSGNLDAETCRAVLALLRGLLRAHEGTLIVVTHSSAVAGGADRVLSLEDGVIADREGGLAW